MSETNRLCPVCRRPIPEGGGAFCPFCGAALNLRQPLPPEAQKALDEAARTDDPVKKYKLLTAARDACPDCLEIQRELLFLGRLHQRNPKNLSYDVIKCYLLHFYLTPENFSQEKKDEMRRELFEDPQLKRCQALAQDETAFTREYLERLSREFIHLFLEGSSYYMHSIFGFTMKKNAAKLLAAPAAVMLRNMELDQALSQERRNLLMNAFYAAFARQMDGDAAPLLTELEKSGCTLPG